MELIENKYETAGLLMLPPHARDVAEHLLTITPLDKLVAMQQTLEPDQKLLKRFKAPESLWKDILNAALLAKATYFFVNPDFSKEELLYLMKAACLGIDKPLNVYSVKEVIEISGEDYPVLTEWLTEMAMQLKKLTKNSA